MKVVFLSNYLTHHQTPFCEAMYQNLGEDFCFLSSIPMTEERKQDGWKLSVEYPYEIKIYINDEYHQKAWERVEQCDILMAGSGDERLVHLAESLNKTIFRYSERIFKDGRLHVFSPRAIKNIVLGHAIKKNTYMLCASAYSAGDYGLLGAYWRKCFKWGYFPAIRIHDVNALLRKKPTESFEVIWCGRYLSWKHPEIPIHAVATLSGQYPNLRLTMIGQGAMLPEMRELAEKLGVSEKIIFIECLSPKEVREYMERSHIFLFTSNFREGWGAVLNEAMNSGCAVIASHAIGSVPYLIRNGENGLVFRNGDEKELCEHISSLIEDPERIRQLGERAYKTIAEHWNADNAAQRLLQLFDAVLKDESLDLFEEGICSKDEFLSNNWYKRKKT